MKSRVAAVTLLAFTFVLIAAVASAKEMTTKWPFAFVEQFPGIVDQLGLKSGNRLSIGIFVIQGDSPVKSVTMRNLKSGETLEVPSADTISGLFSADESPPILYNFDPMPLFDPEKHTGLWEVTVTDEEGNTVVDKTHNLDKTDELPFVRDLRVSGDPLSPTVTWKEPDPEAVPSWCRKEYRVRLFKDIDTQLHRSDPLSEGKYEVPEGLLKNKDIADTYIRVEFTCYDNEDKDHSLPLERRSETLELLQDLLI